MTACRRVAAVKNLLNGPGMPLPLPGLGRHGHRVQDVGDLPIAELLFPEAAHFLDDLQLTPAVLDPTTDDAFAIG